MMTHHSSCTKKNQYFFQGSAVFVLLVLADQLSKYLACVFLKPRRSLELLPGIFQLYYLENRGAAFGMMNNRQLLFIAAALIMTAVIGYVYCRLPLKQEYHALRLVCIVIASGAVGNMLDRIFRGFVVDFLYVSLIDFPVFNIADCYVCLGIVLLVILLFTRYKEEPFDFLIPSGK